MREMTPAEADALARFLVVVRPDWSLEYAIPAVRNMRLIDSSLERVTRVAINGALARKGSDFVLRKPDVLAMTGDHWRATHDRADSEPSRAELCRRCKDWHMPHVDCEVEGWQPKPTRASERTAAFTDQLRAELDKARADLCMHGAKICADCQRAREHAETTEETPR